MNDGYFIRIIYSNSLFILNGINLCIPLHDIILEKYYNKYKCSFSIAQHQELIDQLKLIEEHLLIKTNIKNKTPQLKIHDQIKNGNIKLFLDNVFFHDKMQSKNYFILKISGVWETETHFGLTYKFIKTLGGVITHP
jgi:hypothetical protein